MQIALRQGDRTRLPTVLSLKQAQAQVPQPVEGICPPRAISTEPPRKGPARFLRKWQRLTARPTSSADVQQWAYRRPAIAHAREGLGDDG